MAKVVFLGTPEFVLSVLDALKNAGHEIMAVVTQPPKPVGRKQTLASSPVALWAQTHGIAIFDGKPKEIVEDLKKFGAEVGVLAAYGRILPPELLTIFPHGIVNIHPSLLPKYRGASPIQAAIASGEKETGVTIIKLDSEMDHGPIVAQFTEDILENDTAGTLRKRLFQKAAESLPKILERYTQSSSAYIAMKINLQEQNHTKATYTTLLKKEHGFIPPKYIQATVQGDPPSGLSLRVEDLHSLQREWQIPFIKDYLLIPDPYSLARFVRALDPWPGAWTEVKSKIKNQKSKRLKILKAHVEKKLAPNTRLRRQAYYLVPDLVQLEGKNPVSWEEFKKGYPETKFF